MSNKVTCPICHKELNDNETLIAYYYKPKQWWVISHLIQDNKSRVDVISSEFGDDLPSLEGWKSYCGKAGYQFSHYSDTK